jgi:copper chaperone CopZ
LSNHNGFKLQGRKETGKEKKKRVSNHPEVEMEDIEELEKILAEKVENDEGWRELEIGEVKPVYIGRKKHIYTVTLGDLAEVPGSPYAYWAPKTLRELFQKYPPLDRDVARQKDKPKIADVKQGLATADDLRFTRFWWEVDANNIATSREETYHKKWVPFAKGGKPFYHDMQVVVNWLNNGEEIRNFEKAVIRNENFFFREGLAWARIASAKHLEAWYMPSAIFSVSALAAFISNEHRWQLLSYMNSSSFTFMFFLLQPLMHDRHIGYVARLPIASAVLESERIASLSYEAYGLLRIYDTGNGISTQFIMPWLLQVWRGFSHDWRPVTNHPIAKDFEWSDFELAKELRGENKKWRTEAGIIALAEECVQRERKLRKRLDDIQNAIDDEVYRIYDISEEDQRLIEEELSTVEPEEGKTESKEKKHDDLMPAAEHIKRLLSYFAHEVMKEDKDGIVPVSDMFLGTQKEPGMATRVIAKLTHEFGAENLDRIETELTKVLKMSIDDWYAKEFFAYHTTLYRLRPVIWQLSSEGKAFSCFLYWHKLDADTIPKVRQLYLKPVFEAAKMEVENVKTKLPKVEGREKRQVESEFESVLTKYEELKAFDAAFAKILKPHKIDVTSKSNWVMAKVGEITQEGYMPERDYGVRVNIEPLKQAGLMPKTADKVKG